MSRTNEPTRDVFESSRRGLRHHGVRRANSKTVLSAVAFNAGASNAEIARLSDLAPQTVSAILGDLEQQGLIKRGPLLRGRRGQPATPITLDENGGFAIGVEIGWRHLEVVLLNMHASVLQSRHVDYPFPDARSIVDTIVELAGEVSADLPPQHRARLLDLGVAMPGRLADNVDLLNAPDEQSLLWRQLDLAGELERRSSLSVSVFNDGNAGCWAELIALQPPRPANVIYLLVSHFVAAGVVGDGSLWEGPTGNAAELGSILVTKQAGGPEIAHRIASIWALRQTLEEAGLETAALTTEALGNAQFQSLAGGWIDAAAGALAEVVFNAATMVERPLVILDTLLPRSTTVHMVEKVVAALGRLPGRSIEPPRVKAGQLGGLAPAIGAAELPLYRRYF